MLIRPIDRFLVAWFALAAASTAYVAWDQCRNNPEPTVMKWGFILVTLYMGPLGLLLYVLADKEPRPGEHDFHQRPVETRRRLNHSLRRRRRHWDHSGRSHHGGPSDSLNCESSFNLMGGHRVFSDLVYFQTYVTHSPSTSGRGQTCRHQPGQRCPCLS